MSRFMNMIREMHPEIGDEGQKAMAKNEILRALKEAGFEATDREYGGDTLILSVGNQDVHLTVTNITQGSNSMEDESEIDPVTDATLRNAEELDQYDSPQAKAAQSVGTKMAGKLREIESRL